MFGNGSLRGLMVEREGRSARVSSYDKTGKNADFIAIPRGKREIIADIPGPGCINHIWMTVNCPDKMYLRKILLRMFWDHEKQPSVEVPLGDFFGVGHSRVSHYIALPLNMITGGEAQRQNCAAMNCFFPMPFTNRARIEIVNQCSSKIPQFFFYIDYETWSESPSDLLRFHAQWRRENPTKGLMDKTDPKLSIRKVWKEANTSGKENYTILDARGKGHFVGCNLSIDNIDPTRDFPWFGEGDDMFFIDGEPWPPSLHGTGTEDYFCAAWGYPSLKYSAPYHGVSLAGSTDEGATGYSGKWTMYRFHIEDPVMFAKSLHFSIEHGHANASSNDYSSTAYWYQTEPHKRFPKMPKASDRLPLPDKESLRRYFRTV